MYQKLFELQEEITKTLANRKRLEIIHLLRDKELSVSDMVSMLGLRQSNLSQHLSVLRSVDIVLTRRDGSTIYYSLSDKRISKAHELIRDFLKKTHKLDDDTLLLMNKKDAEVYPIIVDPVCGMRLSLPDIAYSQQFENSTYYFCAEGCKNKFTKSPKRFSKLKVKERVLV